MVLWLELSVTLYDHSILCYYDKINVSTYLQKIKLLQGLMTRKSTSSKLRIVIHKSVQAKYLNMNELTPFHFCYKVHANWNYCLAGEDAWGFNGAKTTVSLARCWHSLGPWCRPLSASFRLLVGSAPSQKGEVMKWSSISCSWGLEVDPSPAVSLQIPSSHKMYSAPVSERTRGSQISF